MATLRDPQQGCPWDIEQDFASIAPYTIEEAYEVADVIEREAWDELPDELGDLLLQVVFHAQMARERGWFEFADVAAAISAKMIRRHPHVFADGERINATEQTEAWEAHKQRERQIKGYTSVLDGVPAGLAELTRAVKLQKRAARVGFDWPEHSQILDKLDEELAEFSLALRANNRTEMLDELGDILFVVANLARKLELDPAVALRHANSKFERRFRLIETLAEQGLDALSLEQQEALWQQAKRQLADPDGG